ncbi:MULTISPECIES: acetylornithine transaminase [unclassified Helicobacter]|uniref:acetylornithine transaminase n=1 Tax=unclassified Helicobacter TaxID=2593540 RepID=UPI000CF17927|nr:MULTISPECIES: acetylornithine transaminase [unclassified Helicobacter]
MSKEQENIKQDQEYLLNTYAKQYLFFHKAKGSRLWNEDNQDYIDFSSGIGVCSVGHCNDVLNQNLKEQLDSIVHTSNLYNNSLQTQLAKKIVQLSGYDMGVFFSNSGAEANECAIKIARKFGEESQRYEIITLESSFHGRTIATLKATGQKKFHQHFGPFPKGFKIAKDIEHIKKLISKKTCAVMIELIQGEGGVRSFDQKQIQDLSRFLKKNKVLLIIDEVQSGVYRSGSFLASQEYNITPDIITLAKGLGGGIPIGATLTNLKTIFFHGDHGSTFGGNFLAMRAGISVLSILEQEFNKGALQKNINSFKTHLDSIIKDFPNLFIETTGMGLMLGLKALNQDIFDKVIKNSLVERVLVLKSGNNVVRFLPPLNISEEEISEGFKRFRIACIKVEAR